MTTYIAAFGLILGLIFISANMIDEAREDAEFRTRVEKHMQEHKTFKFNRQQIIQRDDAILDRFMNGGWDRSKCVMLYPEELLADGTWLRSIELVDCEE